MSSLVNSLRNIFTRNITKKNNAASKIQSKIRGYNTRKLTNTIKKNSRLYLQGPSKKETYNKKTMILKRVFDNTHQEAYGTGYNARDEVKLIMSNLGSIEKQDVRAYDRALEIEYQNEIFFLVRRIKNKLNGFKGTTEQSRAKVHKELEELRYLFYIPFHRAWGWSHSDQNWKQGNPRGYRDEEWSEGKKLYSYYREHGWQMDEWIRENLPTLFPEPNSEGYMRMGGRQKNTHTKKLHKTSF